MIIVVMKDRIGNQLFQYAAGRRLAAMNSCPLYFYSPYHKCVLSRFGLIGNTINPLPTRHARDILSKIPVFKEKGHFFHDIFSKLPRSCILLGYFQNEKYFKPIEKTLRKELSFDGYIMTSEAAAIEHDIIMSNSVSVHIRRGDYLNKKRYSVCNYDYYEKAISRIREKVENPHFYFFSDDIKWCKKTFRGIDYSFVDTEQSRIDHLVDMKLMSRCKHNIIANSSFSWWGAWLNKNPNKNVLAPYIWFNANDVPIDEKLCAGWEKVFFKTPLSRQVESVKLTYHLTSPLIFPIQR